MEHHYLITEDIAAIAAADKQLPSGIDYEANIYFRQERNGMLLGTYEPKSTPWKVHGTPMDFGHELLNPDLDRIAERLEMSFERIPAIGQSGIKSVINGPFTFGPDGNPMIGPVPGMQNLLGRGGRNGWVLSRWWGRFDHGRVDDGRRTVD